MTFPVCRLGARPTIVGGWTVERQAAAQGNGRKLQLHLRRDGEGHLWTARADHFLSDPDKELDESTWVTDLLFLMLQED